MQWKNAEEKEALRHASASLPPNPVLVIRSHFSPKLALLGLLPLQIFLSVWAGAFFTSVGLWAGTELGLKLPGRLYFCGSAVLVFALFSVSHLLYRKLAYARSVYHFYPDRMAYVKGILATERKTVLYRGVREVTLRCGMLQRGCGLGTLILATSATGPDSQGVAGSGIRIPDIPDPEAVYARVMQLIGS